MRTAPHRVQPVGAMNRKRSVVTNSISTVTAVPCGNRRNGSPIPRREFAVVRAPEPFGAGKSRLWGKCPASARHGLDRIAPLAVVWTGSIEQVTA